MPSDYSIRAEYVRLYLKSGLSQPEFCSLYRAQGGPSERTLRTWVAALTKPTNLRAEARAVIVEAVERLQGLLAAFDAVAAAQGGHRAVQPDDDALAAAARSRTGVQADAQERAAVGGRVVAEVPAAFRSRAAAPAFQVDSDEPAAAESRAAIPDATGARGALEAIAAVVQAAVAQGELDPAPADSRDEDPGVLRPAPSIDTATNHPLAGGTPNDTALTRAGHEPQGQKRRTFAELVLSGPDGEDAARVGGDAVDEQHPDEPERHDASKIQPTVTLAPEQTASPAEPVLPVAMPAVGRFSWC